MKKISVIGSGTMGNGIAHCFAQYGFNVNLVDISIKNLDQAKTTIDRNLDRMIQKKIILESEKEIIINRIAFNTELNQTVKNSDLIIEAATESKEIKLDIFKKLDELCEPNTILASNTSSISIGEIGKVTNRKDKIIGMHFMNPVPIMKLVEVITNY